MSNFAVLIFPTLPETGVESEVCADRCIILYEKLKKLGDDKLCYDHLLSNQIYLAFYNSSVLENGK